MYRLGLKDKIHRLVSGKYLKLSLEYIFQSGKILGLVAGRKSKESNKWKQWLIKEIWLMRLLVKWEGYKIMLTIRATNKLQKFLGMSYCQPQELADEWYANLFYHNRKKCLIFTHAKTLFSFFVYEIFKKDLRDFTGFFKKNLSKTLFYSEYNSLQIQKALEKVDNIQIAKTVDRSALGSMNEFVYKFEVIAWEDFYDKIGEEEMAEIIKIVNNIPQKTINYSSPKEMFDAFLNGKVIISKSYTQTQEIQKFSVEHATEGFSSEANKVWLTISKEIRDKLLKNVYCGQCQKIVTICDYTGMVTGSSLVLRGKCKVCGHKVARVIEEVVNRY